MIQLQAVLQRYRVFIIGFAMFIVCLLIVHVLNSKSRDILIENFQSLVENAHKSGILIHYKDLNIDGWPWNRRLHLVAPSLQFRGPNPWSVTSDGSVYAHYNLFNPQSITLDSNDGLVIKNDSSSHQLFVNNFQSELALSSNQSHKININGLKLKQFEDILGTIERVTLDLKSSRAFFKPIINDIAVSQDPSITVLTTAIKSLKCRYIPFDDVRQLSFKMKIKEQPTSGQSLLLWDEWQIADNTVDMEDFVIKADKLFILAEGSMSLDEQRQPLATLTARVNGIPETIDDFTARDIITIKKANVYKAAYALAMMLNKSQDLAVGFNKKDFKTLNDDRSSTADNQLQLSLTIQDRALNVGAIKILDLPFINWKNMTLGSHEK